uniref:Heterogeneous nuclear ribonucleoprotein Q acidic domain-containing protein n=1 Tax=Tetradesmus obliquus TaxID=3088 RepID=A0A383VQL5_TETOB|eukprot:jgi/Sobl393_1/11606/SZX67024.1
MVMQLAVAGDSSFCGTCSPGGITNADLGLLWPSNSSDDVIRQHLTAILLEDPDHRLRVAHLEPLLHLRMASQHACSSGRLQALLTDPSTARIFPVDFSNTRASDWRSRVVYLDLPQLLKEAAAVKQQQQQLGSATAAAGDMHGMYADSSGSVLQAGSEAQCGRLPSDAAAAANMPSPQHHHSMHSQGQLMLESIFGASPALGRVSDAAEAAQRRTSGSMGGTAGGSYGTAGSMGGEPRVSLFGSSFEVPHAVASCWAGAASSCGSGAGSMPGAAAAAAAAAAASGAGNNNISGSGKEQLLHGAEAGSGGSSSGSGSSTRSVSAATRAAQAAASRLRKASSNTPAGFDCSVDGPGADMAVAGSSGGLSGIDVCTPKSAGVGVVSGDASASPVHSSSAAEEDVEYSEAQLVFGVTGSGSVPNGNGVARMSAGGSAALSSATAAAAEAAAADAEYLSQAAAAAAAAAAQSGMSGRDGPPVEGVDWARVAAMQRQQQQQRGMAPQFGRMQHPQHASLLFGLDDLSEDLPGSSAPAGLQGSQYLQQQQQQHAAAAAAAAQQHAYASSLAAARQMLLDQAGYGGFDPAASAALFSPPQHRISLGSAPAAGAHHDLFLQAEHAAMFGGGGAAAAAAAAAAAGFGCIGAGSTAAQLAESVLLEGDNGHGLGSQQLQFGLHGASYGSSSGGGGGWRTSPSALAGHFGALQQQQQQQMLHRPSDAAVDVGFRSDQVKEPGAAAARSGSAGGAAAAGKPLSFAAAAAAAPAGSDAAAAAAEAEKTAAGTPRLTGWASIAAKDPKPLPGTPNAAAAAAAAGSSAGGGPGGAVAAGMWAHGRPQSAAGSSAAAAAAAAGSKAVGCSAAAGEAGKPLGRLPPRVRAEVQGLVGQFNGVLKAEDFDEGVVHQLNAKRSEEEAVAAVRHIAHYDLANIQHMAAYLNHLVKHYNHGAAAAAAAAAADGAAALAGHAAAGLNGAVRTGSAGGISAGGGQLQACSLGSTLGSSRGGSGAGGVPGSAAAAAAAGGNLGAFGGQIRLASVPVSTKSMLQKLPLKVFRQLEALVASCAYLEWRHFDAGVVKVLAQLSKLCEADVFEELELLAATDLSNVEYMPAYLNKRLNNKLWSRRKADGHVPSG